MLHAATEVVMNPTAETGQEKQSFAETALRMGGKTEDEARRLDAVDKADEQVETLFAPQYQTASSPVHRAIWDGAVPLELFAASPLATSHPSDRVMQQSYEITRRRGADGTLFNADRKLSAETIAELASVGYWGLLIDPR